MDTLLEPQTAALAAPPPSPASSGPVQATPQPDQGRGDPLAGRFRQVEPLPPKTIVRPTPPMEGGPAPVSWTTPPPNPVVDKVATEPPPPVWAQPPPSRDNGPAVPPPAPEPPTEPTPPPEPAPLPAPDPGPPDPLPMVKAAPFVNPAQPRQQPSQVLRRHFKADQLVAKLDPRLYTKAQVALTATAVFVFVIGVAVSLQTVKSNRQAVAQVAALAGQSGQQLQASINKVGQPSGLNDAKPDAKAFSQYVVADDLARYLEIPKLGLVARVSQTGINAKGALGTPDNLYDTAWYAASVKPGKPGVVLIDGLATSKGTAGIFADLPGLAPGDPLQIVRGDGTVLNYRVAAVQSYDADQLTMQTALTPAQAGKPGINLLAMPDPARAKGQPAQSVLVQAVQS